MADFLDKVKQGIDKGVNVVSVRSKEALETARLKSQLAGLADRRREVLTELGGLIYDGFLRDALALGDHARAKCDEIAALDAQIKEKEGELAQVHREASISLGVPVCASCGAELNEEDRFCRKCGAKIE